MTNVRREITPLLFGAQEEKRCSPKFFFSVNTGDDGCTLSF